MLGRVSRKEFFNVPCQSSALLTFGAPSRAERFNERLLAKELHLLAGI